MNHTITTEQIKALASISDKTEVWLKHAFPAAFSTIMDRVKTVNDANKILSEAANAHLDESWQMHVNRCDAFAFASKVHTALCEGWVPDFTELNQKKYKAILFIESYWREFPFYFETEAKRDYFQTQFADLLKSIITGKP